MERDVTILGVNTSHDRAACLVRNGEVVAFVAEERLDRVKHSVEADAEGNYLCVLPRKAIRYCLDAAGIGLDDVDRIVVSSSVVYHPSRPLRNMTADDLRPQLSDLADFGKVTIINHHLAHAAGAFYSSPFAEAAILVVDGGGNIVGERPKGVFKMPPVEHTTAYLGKDGGLTELWKVTSRPEALNSLGALYHLVTEFVGFGQFQEGKTMGLAPYGRPRLAAEFERAVRVAADGRYEIDPVFQPFDWRGRPIKPAFIKRFGPPRRAGEALRPLDEDMAYGVQHALERALIEIARRVQKQTGASKLCIAGGVGLNSVANKKILDETAFDEVFIVPSAADDGCALGGALWGWHECEGASRRYTMRHAYLGREYGEEQTLAALDSHKDWLNWRKSDDVVAETAALIADGRIVGWHQGGSEAGPRALGHRSILCDSRRQEMVDTLNARVKHREGFRPFAPVVPLEIASEYFDLDCPSPYMLLVAKVLQPDAIPAVTHVDQTGRVQTVTQEENGRYYDLVVEFGKQTGVPVLLNTSFNVAGEPIVETPDDSINCYLSTRIDVLVIGDYVIEKKEPVLSEKIAELSQTVRRQAYRIEQMEQEFERIRQSRGWRLLGWLNRLRDKLPGRRRNVDFL